MLNVECFPCETSPVAPFPVLRQSDLLVAHRQAAAAIERQAVEDLFCLIRGKRNLHLVPLAGRAFFLAGQHVRLQARVFVFIVARRAGRQGNNAPR